MFPGHDDWHGVTDDAVAVAGARRRREKGDEKEVEDDSNDNNNNGYSNDEDREVSKLMTYKRLLDYWASSKGVETKKMPAEWLVSAEDLDLTEEEVFDYELELMTESFEKGLHSCDASIEMHGMKIWIYCR